MGSREELDEVKKLLYENIMKSDKNSFLKNVEKFRDEFKDILEPGEFDDLKKLLKNMKKVERPSATYYEFVLFLVVIAFLIFVFGEQPKAIFFLY